MKKVKNTYLITDREERMKKISSSGMATGLILELEDGSFWSAYSTSQVCPFEEISESTMELLKQRKAQ